MIQFEEKAHTYTNTDTDEKYISVTTLIDKYVPEFDSIYWSLYKAIKDVLGSYNRFKVYKVSVGGWENVVGAWKTNPLHIYCKDVEFKQQEYLDKWDLISEEACVVGNIEHKKRELEVSCSNHYEHDNIIYDTPAAHSQTDILNFQDFTTNRVYTELLVYNDRYKVAGQVDWVLKKGNRVHIRDYKTSKEITKEAFRNETLLYPLNDLFNANWYIYNLQMSVYGWLLEQCGYKVDRLELLHTRTNKLIVMPYLKLQVERMMEDYVTF